MQILKCHLWHNVSTNAEEHTPHNAECHNDETNTEERIEACNDLIDWQECCHRIVYEDDAEPHEYFLSCQLGEQHCWARHKYNANKNEQDNGEDTHDLKHDVS